MKSLLLLNDIHLGAVRSAGTTVTTRTSIQDYLQESFKETLWLHAAMEAIVNGDLFDGYEVDTGQVLRAYLTVHGWLTDNPERRFHAVRGNHDIAKNSLRTSSFALFCKLLQTSFPDRFYVYNDELDSIIPGVWVIPHCVNQDLFDMEIAKLLDTDMNLTPGFILLHANFDNNFAVEADHSLNVSEDTARKLVKRGHTLVFAHEHQRRSAMAGQVIICGNQWPSSVSDCLAHGDAQKDGRKFAHIIDIEEDFMSEKATISLRKVQTWQADGDYTSMDVFDLQPTDCRFIRIEGDVGADQSADVINAIARYRQKSDALVITNAVKVAGVAGVGEMTKVSVESLQKVDVLQALCKQLTKPEADKVRELLGEGDAQEAEEVVDPAVA